MKKSILTFVLMSLAIGGMMAKGNGKSTLKIEVKNLKNTDGKVFVSLFDKEENFLTEGIEKSTSIDDNGTVVVVFENLEAGTYAASVYHDANDNGELDKVFFGIPVESYGFSNDARGSFGPASFEDAKFTISGDQQIAITVQ